MRVEFQEIDRFIPAMLSPDFGFWIAGPSVPPVHPFCLHADQRGVLQSPAGIVLVASRGSSSKSLPDGTRILLLHPVMGKDLPDHLPGVTVVRLQAAEKIPDPHRYPVLPAGIQAPLQTISEYGPEIRSFLLTDEDTPEIHEASYGIPLGFGKWTAQIYSQPESVSGRDLPGFCLECGGGLASLAGALLRLGVRRASFEEAIPLLDAMIFDVLRMPALSRWEFLTLLARAVSFPINRIRVQWDRLVEAILWLGVPRPVAWQLLEGAGVLAYAARQLPFREILHDLGAKFSRDGDRLLTIPVEGSTFVMKFREAMEVMANMSVRGVSGSHHVLWVYDLRHLEGKLTCLMHSGIFEKRGSVIVFPVLVWSHPDQDFTVRGHLLVDLGNVQFSQAISSNTLQVVEIYKTRKVLHVRVMDPPKEWRNDGVLDLLRKILLLEASYPTTGQIVLEVSRIPIHRHGERAARKEVEQENDDTPSRSRRQRRKKAR